MSLIDFSTLRALTIPEGNVIRIQDINGNILWENDLANLLIDFEYIINHDGTVTLTAWKQTLNGVPSTEMIIPDDSRIIL